MQYEPVWPRAWVNTGCGQITPGTVVGDHINTPGVRQVTLDGGALVHAVSAGAPLVQQSEGFLDLPVELRQRVNMELDHAWVRDVTKLHFLKFALQQTKQVRNLLRENNLDQSEAAREVFKLLQVQQKRVDDAQARLDFEYADDKMDVIKETLPTLSANAAVFVQQSRGFTDLDDDTKQEARLGFEYAGDKMDVQQSGAFTDLAEETKQEVFQQYDARRELLQNQFQGLCIDVYVLEQMKRVATVAIADDYVMSESHCEKAFDTARQMARTFFRGIPRRLSKQEYVQELNYWINEKTIERDAFERELNDFAPWKIDLLKNAPSPSVCAPLVQQSAGLLEMPKDIRLRLYREARQMRQKDENDKREKLQSQKALYEKYERMRGMQETIVRMAASGYDGESPMLEHMRSSLSAYTAKYDAMRNEHEQKYGSFNPLNPYSAITSNSGGLVNAVQQSAGFTDLDDDTREEVFKRYDDMKEQLEDELYELEFNLRWLRQHRKIVMKADPNQTYGPAVFKTPHEMRLPMRGKSRSLHKDDLIEELDHQINEQTTKRDAVRKELQDLSSWKLHLLKTAP